MKLRNATLDDIGVLTDFNAAMALETEQLHLNREVLAAGIREVIIYPRHGYYLIAEDVTICASLMVTSEWSDWRNGMFWWIQSVYVHPKYRRSGCFKEMYQKLKMDADQDTECVGLRLYVEKENVKAQQTYQAMGMKKTNYKLFEYTKTQL